ncbi:MAG: hypothetical protein FD149_6 [Rhodospirillaceae bacterium]|nr:MAG: hypothetical protein FD149_6 [Rhodospirillaceae bacterium]
MKYIDRFVMSVWKYLIRSPQTMLPDTTRAMLGKRP